MMVKISAKDVNYISDIIGALKGGAGKIGDAIMRRGPAPGEQGFLGSMADSITNLIRPGKQERSGLLGTLADMPSRNGLLGAALNTAGIIGLGGMAAGALSQVYNAVEDKLKSQSAYDGMFEEFPELKDADRKQVDKYWTVLRDYSPELTRNPLVAGQFVSNMMQYGMRGIDHNTIGQLASIHNDLNRDRSNNLNMLGGLAGNLIKEDYKGLINEAQ